MAPISLKQEIKVSRNIIGGVHAGSSKILKLPCCTLNVPNLNIFLHQLLQIAGRSV